MRTMSQATAPWPLRKPTVARKRRGQAISGWLALDKPSGLTSTQALGKARRFLDAAKAGHGGTLDPLATGILPIAFGEATKTVSYAMDSKKSYRFEVTWGATTATDDREGEVIATSEIRPDPAQIEAALPSFLGNIEQVPPPLLSHQSRWPEGLRSGAGQSGRHPEGPDRAGRPVCQTRHRVRP